MVHRYLMTDAMDHAVLHLWNLSTLVCFIRRFCRDHLAVRLQALLHGSMTLPAAQSHRTAKCAARHGGSSRTERTVHVPVSTSVNVHKSDCALFLENSTSQPIAVSL